MKINKKVVFTTAITFLFTATIAFAASSSDFQSKAQTYITDNCDKNIVSEEKSLGCYLFYKSGELETGVTTLQTEVTTLQTGVSTLETRVTTLESNSNPPIDNDFQVTIANTSLQQASPNNWLPRLEARPTWKDRQIDSAVSMHGTWHTASGDVSFVVNGSFNFPQTFLQPIDASTPITIPVDVTVVWQNLSKTISTSITVPN